MRAATEDAYADPSYRSDLIELRDEVLANPIARTFNEQPRRVSKAPRRVWRMLREMNALTLDDVATRLDVHRSTVSRWEAGILDPGYHAPAYRRLLEQLEHDFIVRLEIMLVMLAWFDRGKPDLQRFCAAVDSAGSLEAAGIVERARDSEPGDITRTRHPD